MELEIEPGNTQKYVFQGSVFADPAELEAVCPANKAIEQIEEDEIRRGEIIQILQQALVLDRNLTTEEKKQTRAALKAWIKRNLVKDGPYYVRTLDRQHIYERTPKLFAWLLSLPSQNNFVFHFEEGAES